MLIPFLILYLNLLMQTTLKRLWIFLASLRKSSVLFVILQKLPASVFFLFFYFYVKALLATDFSVIVFGKLGKIVKNVF